MTTDPNDPQNPVPTLPSEPAPQEEPVQQPVQPTPQEQPVATTPTEQPAQNTTGPLVQNPQARGRIYNNILETIGNTPLVRLPRLTQKYQLEANILAKLEFFNPATTDKDRIAFGMIEAAERAGTIKAGETVLIESTSGDTGVSLAMVAAAKGDPLIMTMPESIAIERRKLLSHLGAELALTPAEKGMKGAIDRANELADEHENALIIKQFENPANPQIHSETTAQEIWIDTAGNVDILVCGVGTGGMLTGVAKALKAHKPDIRVFAVEPENSPVLSGGQGGGHKIQGIGAGFVPPILDTTLIDSVVKVSDEQTYAMGREAARLEGLSVGISAGAALSAAIEVAKLPTSKGKQIVVIIPSAAERYISTDFFK